jgi:transcriptional regulator with XRE-family HTH domain
VHASLQSETGTRLKLLRRRAGMTLRDLGKKAGIAPSYLSNLERNGNSPSLATLQRVLTALGASLEEFFAEGGDQAQPGCVFRRERMRMASDSHRHYTFLLPRRKDIKAEILEEYMLTGENRPELESLSCDVAGVVLSGAIELKIEGERKQLVRAGDCFYVAAGRKHRGRCISPESARLLTVFVPPRY